jgi:hypothetical protein
MTAPVSKFPQVDHGEATGELQQVYQGIQDTLRVPWVAFACRVMATFPGFLPMAWARAAPHFSTRYLEAAADSIRFSSVLPGPNPPDSRPALRAAGWDDARIGALIRVLDALNYGNPKYLLLITAWSEAFQGRDARGREPSGGSVPRGLPPGVQPLHLVDPDTASDEVKGLFRRVMELHYHHGPSSDYRVLGQWPDYLGIALDTVIAPVVRGETYDLAARHLIAEARAWVRELPSPCGIHRSELEHRCSPAELAGLTGLLFMYQRFIADITIDIIRLKQAFEGKEAAGRSPFPV